MTEFDFTNAYRQEAWLFLDTVWHGLEYLCEEVDQEERERAKSGKNFAYTDFGNQPGDAMLCNYFIWYANTFCNFIRVFNKAFSPSENLEEEFANVITWRNKVGAHASWVWPHGDNACDTGHEHCAFPGIQLQVRWTFRGWRLQSFLRGEGRVLRRVAVGSCSHTRAAEGDCEQICDDRQFGLWVCLMTSRCAATRNQRRKRIPATRSLTRSSLSPTTRTKHSYLTAASHYIILVKNESSTPQRRCPQKTDCDPRAQAADDT